MPLSKARDRERKRLGRLESKKVQPKIPGLVIRGNKIIGVHPKVSFDLTDLPGPSPEAESGYDIDADGNPIYDD